jgi:hypothetical protein
MANQPLPPYVRINKEDLGQNIPPWVDGLLGPLNLNFQANYSLFNRGINEAVNLDSMIAPVAISTLPSYIEPTPLALIPYLTKSQIVTAAMAIASFQPVTFESTLTGIPECYYVANLININDSSAIFTRPVFASCSFNNGVISVNYVTGLSPSQSYIMTLKVS